MMKVAVGHSEDTQADLAVGEALNQLRAALGGLNPQAGILFCSVDLEHALILKAIRDAFPEIELVGCTTDGELSSAGGFSEDSLTLIVFYTDTIEIKAGVGRDAAQGGAVSGSEAASAAQRKLSHYPQQTRFAVILADPLNAGISGISQGIETILGRNFPIIGAASAAHSKKRSTYQFYHDNILTDSLVLLLFAGPVVFSCGIKGGHAPMGGKERVTQARKNVLYRIGDKSAFEYFSSYIGDKYSLFMNYCLAVYEEGREGFYVRSAPFSDPESGTVTLNGNVPEGAWVQIGTADKDVVVKSCAESLQLALTAYPAKQPAAALLFSCAGRKMIMGTQVVREVETAREMIGAIPFGGFYAYGEFGPLQKGAPSLFHGTTFVTLLLGPADEGR